MRDIIRLGVIVSLLAVSAGVLAQGNEPPPEGRPGGPGRMRPADVAQRLAETLKLTAEQRAQYDAIVAQFQAQWQEQEGQQEQMRELARQYRDARESGDEQRAQQIREQMRAARTAQAEQLQAFIAKVEPILDAQQLETLKEFRQNMQGPGPDGQRDPLRRLIRRLPDELNMTPEQRAQYDKLVGDQQAQGERLREQWRKARELGDEIRKARQEGNEKRVAELEQQLKEAQSAPSPNEKLLDQISSILTDEQKAKLAELRAAAPPPPPRRADNVKDVQQVIQAAKRLKLSDEQRNQLKEIIRAAQAPRGKDGDTPEAKLAAAQSVKAQIVALLDANQAAEFERFLEGGPRRPPGPTTAPASKGTPAEPGEKAKGGTEPKKP